MEFDYVVVGAGSAGAVIANRLSADGKSTVALIEAGPRDRNPWIHVPVGYFRTMGNPATDWCYETAEDPGIAGRKISFPRGRVLGGSSSINGLLYVRGQAQDFDGWRQLGNDGWGWNDVRPYFIRAESYDRGGEDRGTDGPLHVSDTTLSRKAVDAWIDAAEAAGFPKNDDYNSGDQEGVAFFQLTTHRGRRCSTSVAYLRPAKHRKNLQILTGRHVARVTLDGKRATGVVTMRDRHEETIRARREVILSAGAINSPQILMLSGIGAPDRISPHGIDIAHALPGVGENLQDHLQARPVYKVRSSTINTEISSMVKQAMIGARYLWDRTGPMTMAASLGTAFLKTRPELETPDIQFHIQPFSADAPGKGTHPFDAITASVLQLRPESTGHVALASADPLAAPEIHPNYLATETDRRTLVDGIRVARKIARHAPFSDEMIEEYSPGVAIADDDYDNLLQWARETSVTIYHPTGTAKMGTDKNAVVDARLRVHGIDGLRVADASIMPVITSGNTNAPTIMIGEKVSDMILEDAAT